MDVHFQLPGGQKVYSGLLQSQREAAMELRVYNAMIPWPLSDESSKGARMSSSRRIRRIATSGSEMAPFR